MGSFPRFRLWDAIQVALLMRNTGRFFCIEPCVAVRLDLEHSAADATDKHIVTDTEIDCPCFRRPRSAVAWGTSAISIQWHDDLTVSAWRGAWQWRDVDLHAVD